VSEQRYTTTAGNPLKTERFEFYLGIDKDGSIIIDFDRPVQLVRLGHDMALKLAEAIAESVIQAKQTGIAVLTPSMGVPMRRV